MVGSTPMALLPTQAAVARKTHDALLRMQAALPGAQYLAVTADHTIADVQVGVTDAATSLPMERASVQMAYSITKALTAIALLQLADTGISLERYLSDFVPTHPYGDTVRLRHLLAHTAGVPNPAPLSWFTLPGEPQDSGARLREQLRAHPRLTATPGARYGYSNLGYWLLEAVIEAASGLDYALYIAERVLRPLGADALASFTPPEGVGVATGHAPRFRPLGLALRALTPARYWTRSAGRWRRTARVVPIGRGYGGLFCPAAALAPILADLLRPRPTLLSPDSRDAMFAPQQLASGKPTGSALGWVCGSLGRARYLGKQGGGLGFHGNVRVYPDLGVATVFLANSTELSAGPIDRRSDTLDSWLARA